MLLDNLNKKNNNNENNNSIQNESDQNNHVSNRKRKYSGNSSASFRSSSNSYEYVSSSDCDEYNVAQGTTDINNKKIKYDEDDDVDDDDENNSNMQPFMIEYDNENNKHDLGKFFMPCVIYLPVKSKLNDSISVRVKLKPVDYLNEHDNLENKNDKSRNEFKTTTTNDKIIKNLTDKIKSNEESNSDKLITTA